MQDHFLFDDDDPKQRGKGCDGLCPRDKRLKFKWRWIISRRNSKKREPCQVSEAILENGWELKAIFWHTEYEAEVRCGDESVDEYRVRCYEGTKSLLSRIDAQLKAEELFEELGKDILRQIKTGKEKNYRRVFSKTV